MLLENRIVIDHAFPLFLLRLYSFVKPVCHDQLASR